MRRSASSISFYRAILVTLVLITILGCSLSSSTTPPGAKDAAPLAFKPVFTQPVSPSATEQILAYEDQISVALPGGSLSADQTLTISTPDGKVPPPSSLRGVLGVYDIALSDQHTFNKPLTLEFTYDPKQLIPDVPASNQLSAGYWDAENLAWVTVPSTVDEARHVIALTTTHLSPWGFFNMLAGDTLRYSDHFAIMYNDKNITAGAAAYYKAVSSPKRTGTPEFISDILNFLEHAYSVYSGASNNFTLPAGRMDVEVDDFTTSELRTLSGIIRISTISWTDPNLLRQDCGHELFHAVQLATLGWYDYIERPWWAEASADYASDRVAWESIGGTHAMGMDIKPKYLETTITSTSTVGNHAYSTSHFVAWLVDHKVASFKDLWNTTARGGNDVLKTLTDAIVSPKPLGLLYTEFARFFIFDPASPDKNTASISQDIAFKVDPLPASEKEVTGSFTVDYYTAKLWAIQNEADRDVLIERLDGDAGMLSYIALQGDTRTSPVSVAPDQMILRQSVMVHLKTGDNLFLLMDNTVSQTPVTFNLKVSAADFPVGMFTMSLGLDSGCDGGFQGDYNSFSRVNVHIPVEITGNQATISYDKTTGGKHLVASGSGKIDDKGMLVLNYTLTYTVERSCDGTPCQGTETAFGTLTARWSPAETAWVGEASGSVDVSYPNTLGKSGNNSISCSAYFEKGKLRPGFTDTDL
jgi:hypothetical protein